MQAQKLDNEYPHNTAHAFYVRGDPPRGLYCSNTLDKVPSNQVFKIFQCKFALFVNILLFRTVFSPDKILSKISPSWSKMQKSEAIKF